LSAGAATGTQFHFASANSGDGIRDGPRSSSVDNSRSGRPNVRRNDDAAAATATKPTSSTYGNAPSRSRTSSYHSRVTWGRPLPKRAAARRAASGAPESAGEGSLSADHIAEIAAFANARRSDADHHVPADEMAAQVRS
jgi:hypothetical protein